MKKKDFFNQLRISCFERMCKSVIKKKKLENITHYHCFCINNRNIRFIVYNLQLNACIESL